MLLCLATRMTTTTICISFKMMVRQYTILNRQIDTDLIAIELGGIGTTTYINVPHTSVGRVRFSYDEKLVFFLNKDKDTGLPLLVEPNMLAPTDPNYYTRFDFAEFTWNSREMYANLTFVDFVSIPISFELKPKYDNPKIVWGLPSDGLETIKDCMSKQTDKDKRNWKGLILTKKDGTLLRILSPKMDLDDFNGYYEPYVNSVWSQYSNGATLTVTVSGEPHSGTVITDDDDGKSKLMFIEKDGLQKFEKPSTKDILMSNTGPFTLGTDPIHPIRDTLIPILAAEFYRSTLLKSSTIPADCCSYYQEDITNHYGRIVHSVSVDHRGYTQPFDEPKPDDCPDVSGYVRDDNPDLLTVFVSSM